MLQITPSISIPDNELIFTFVRSSGPGGQNVNKVATAAQLRFDVRNSPSLPADVRERLIKLAGYRMTQDGILVVEAKRYRTQEQNRSDAEQRLVTLIQKALVRPKRRRPTRPSATAKAKRVDTKKRRGTIKRLRRVPSNHDE
jgi:ribosome-associated protein